MSIISTLERIADDFVLARRRYITERQIEQLPSELRKDIGWPDAIPARDRHTNPMGVWSGGR